MKCEFCGTEFVIDHAKKGCSGCAMSKSCGKIKCPNCNYEMVEPPEFKIFKTMKKWGEGLWKK